MGIASMKKVLGMDSVVAPPNNAQPSNQATQQKQTQSTQNTQDFATGGDDSSPVVEDVDSLFDAGEDIEGLSDEDFYGDAEESEPNPMNDFTSDLINFATGANQPTQQSKLDDTEKFKDDLIDRAIEKAEQQQQAQQAQSSEPNPMNSFTNDLINFATGKSVTPPQTTSANQPQNDEEITADYPVQYLVDNNFTDRVLYKYLAKFKFMPRATKSDLSYSTVDKAENSVWILGTLHYMKTRGLVHLEPVIDKYNKIWFSSNGSKKSAAYTLGILDDYDNNRLPYDKLPDKNRDLARYINTYSKLLGAKNKPNGANDINSFDTPAGNFGKACPDMNMSEETKASFTLQRGEVHKLNPRNTQERVEINLSEVKLPTVKSKWYHKKLGKIIKSKNGYNYAMKQYWKVILKAVESCYPDPNLVTKLAILDDRIIVDKKGVLLSGMLNKEDDYDIKLEYLLSIRDLLKVFPNTKALLIDEIYHGVMIQEFFEADPSLKADDCV